MGENALSISVINRWDDNALELLYKNFYKALVNFSYQMVIDMVSAEDIVQDCFAMLWERKLSYESMAQLKVYMYNTVRNMSLNHLRNLKIHDEKIQILGKQYDELQLRGEEEDLYGPEVYRQLMLMIEQLPEGQRKVFLMAMEGKQNLEIAEALELSVNTVKTHKRRALKFLKEHLDAPTFLLLLITLPN